MARKARLLKIDLTPIPVYSENWQWPIGELAGAEGAMTIILQGITESIQFYVRSELCNMAYHKTIDFYYEIKEWSQMFIDPNARLAQL